jgi:hypothetical protein
MLVGRGYADWGLVSTRLKEQACLEGGKKIALDFL